MSAPGSTRNSKGIPALPQPVWQAPIGSVAGPELAQAVARSGGMGALALTWRSPDQIRAVVSSVAAVAGERLQGNFVLAFEPAGLPAALEAGLRVVTFSWGMPGRQVALLRSFGARFGVQVTGRDSARMAIDTGADFLICQGVEAGGHVQATRSLWETLPEVLAEAGGVPVIAAGGIASGRVVARVLAAGASGAMLGTRFVATQESFAHDAYKQRLVEAVSADAVLTVCFDLGWPYAPHRVLRNSTLTGWEAAGCPPSGRRPGEGDVVARSRRHEFVRYSESSPLAPMTGDVEGMCLYAGTGCGEITDIPVVADLMARLAAEREAV